MSGITTITQFDVSYFVECYIDIMLLVCMYLTYQISMRSRKSTKTNCTLHLKGATLMAAALPNLRYNSDKSHQMTVPMQPLIFIKLTITQICQWYNEHMLCYISYTIHT